ncbi:MAG: AvrD family protein, partial [Actinomycetes bacterium]
MGHTPLLYRSIDDYLGPAQTRFFGHGYRRAQYRVADVTSTPADYADPGVRATVTIDYPLDWSVKETDVDLRPHLSTVDMLVLGVQF